MATTRYDGVDDSSPNFRHGIHFPSIKLLSGTGPAVMRLDSKGNTLTAFGEYLGGHPEVGGNVQTDWTITRQDGQPDSEKITFEDGTQYTRSFTYNASGILTQKTKWTVV